MTDIIGGLPVGESDKIAEYEQAIQDMRDTARQLADECEAILSGERPAKFTDEDLYMSLESVKRAGRKFVEVAEF